MIIKKLSFFLVLVLFTTLFSAAQDQPQSALEKIRQQQLFIGGTLFGKIRDENSGDNLIGANIFIVNTKLGASTDIDGKYQIKKIPEGIYDVRISFLGYETKLITGVAIRNEIQTELDVSLTEDQGILQQEVVVSASVIKSGEGAILAERRKAASIGDGISSEQMRKAPDATSGDALKRVTGVTLVDNKYVFVRGVTDRYNQTTLNGASVTSTSVDKKSFSFDMLPSNLLENMNVAKTATPDLPGDFTGGLVQLNTLDFPEVRTIKFVYSGGINSITTFEQFNRSQGGKNDWFAADDGIRKLPNGVNTAADARLLETKATNTFAPRNINAPMNQSLSISIADVYDINESQFGYLAAFSYRNNFQRTNLTLNDYNGRALLRDLTGTSDRFSVLWGGIFDLSYKFGLHKISLKNNYNKTAEDKYNFIDGIDNNNAQYMYSYLNEWEERGMFSTQLSGEHKFPDLLDINADWMAYFSEATTSQPDRKQVDYNLSDAYSPEERPYQLNFQFTSRSWAALYDKTGGQKLNFTLPMDKIKLKAGILNEKKYRRYDIRYFQITNDRLTDYSLPAYGIDSVFSSQNFGAGKFAYKEHTKPSDKYSAEQHLFAAYIMVDVPFTILMEQFRFTGGVRMEDSNQDVFTNGDRAVLWPTVNTIDKRDFLPSLNVTYLINELQNLRIAYSHTVNRPEFRELANVYFYDFDKFEYVVGSSILTRAYVRNYDIRYEIFPDLGDLFALSYFYKNISAPIEEQRRVTSYTERSWLNAEKAKNYGFEIEIRKHFGFITEYMRYFQVVANYSRIYSQVPYRVDASNSSTTKIIEGTRVMQGQSPYMYNISIFFTEPTLGTSFNILYNEYGSRINAIGDIASDDFNVIEQKRGTADFSLTQPLNILLNGLEAKYTIKNLNNQPIVFTHGVNQYRRDEVGITHSLQFSINF